MSCCPAINKRPYSLLTATLADGGCPGKKQRQGSNSLKSSLSWPTQAPFQGRKQLCSTDDADRFRCAHNQYLSDLVRVHFGDDIINSNGLVHTYGISGYDGIDPQAMYFLSENLAFLPSEQPFEPKPLRTTDPQFLTMKKIALGDHSDQNATIADDG
jgi:hypothetical protein